MGGNLRKATKKRHIWCVSTIKMSYKAKGTSGQIVSLQLCVSKSVIYPWNTGKNADARDAVNSLTPWHKQVPMEIYGASITLVHCTNTITSNPSRCEIQTHTKTVFYRFIIPDGDFPGHSILQLTWSSISTKEHRTVSLKLLRCENKTTLLPLSCPIKMSLWFRYSTSSV